MRRSPEFRRVMDHGGRGAGELLAAFLGDAGGDGGSAPGRSRLGVVASRRVGSAVARNRAKRRLREIYRRSPERPAGDLVLVARRGLSEAPWPEVLRSYRTAVRRAVRRAGDSGAAARRGSRRP